MKKSTTFSYLAYGLGIKSVFRLPECLAAPVIEDVSIIRKNYSNAPKHVRSPKNKKPLHFHSTKLEEIIVSFSDIAVFSLKKGKQITVFPMEESSMRSIEIVIVRVVLGLLLCQRNFMVLHASAVNINGAAIAIIGKSRVGKSSIAAALHTQGNGIIADDVLAVDFSSKTPRAIPGFPELKLSPDVIKCLGYDGTKLPKVHSEIDMHALRNVKIYSSAPVPIKCIYILHVGEHFKIEAINHDEALKLLLNNTLYPNLNPSIKLFYEKLSKAIPVYSVTRADALGEIAEIALALNKHYSNLNEIYSNRLAEH